MERWKKYISFGEIRPRWKIAHVANDAIKRKRRGGKWRARALIVVETGVYSELAHL